MIHIVLLEPEIPANTGNIGRTCVATGSRLHLIEPLGFDISEKAVRRAGMDYWKDIDLRVYKNYEEFLAKNPGARPYMATTKGQSLYSDVPGIASFVRAMSLPCTAAKRTPSALSRTSLAQSSASFLSAE